MFETFFGGLYKLRGGRMKVRKWYHSPLYLNLNNYYYTTKIGILSKNISDKSHEWAMKKSYNFAHLITKWHWKRRFMYPFVLISGFMYGYVMISHFQSGNMYERGYKGKTIQPTDYTNLLLGDYAKREDKKYMVMHRKLMHELMEEKGEISVIDWLILGTHYSKAAEEEVAF